MTELHYLFPKPRWLSWLLFGDTNRILQPDWTLLTPWGPDGLPSVCWSLLLLGGVVWVPCHGRHGWHDQWAKQHSRSVQHRWAITSHHALEFHPWSSLTKSEYKSTSIKCMNLTLYSILACKMIHRLREERAGLIETLLTALNSEELFLSMLGFNRTTSGSNLHL